MISLVFAVGVTAWAYSKLSHANGNPDAHQNLGGAAVVGFMAFVFLFTIMKFVFNF